MDTRYDNLVADANTRASEWSDARSSAAGRFSRAPKYRKELRRFKRELLANPAIVRKVSPDLTGAKNILTLSIENALWTLNALGPLPRIPAVNTGFEPRLLAIAAQIVAMIPEFITTTECFLYVNTFQQHTPLSFAEIKLFIPAIKLVLLLELARLRAQQPSSFGAARDFFDLRLLNYFRTEYSTQDWESFVACIVPFEQVLEEDPSLTYQQMDEFSKDLYRSAIARLARRLGWEELDVARQALVLAQRAKEQEIHAMAHKAHIGYYIVDKGASELKAPLRSNFFRTLVAKSSPQLQSFWFYALTQEILAFVFALAILVAANYHWHPWPISFALLCALQIICWQTGHEIANFLLATAVPVRAIPRVDLTLQPSRQPATAVLVPVLLVNERQVEQLFQSLEAQYLTNRSLVVRWVLLTDLPDSLSEPASDQVHKLHRFCIQRVNELNAKYQSAASDHFFVLGRCRKFNPKQGVWMGWERKRGKIENFYDFVRKGKDPFSITAGEVEELKKITHFVVLDEDSELVESALGKLLGTIIHPLNRVPIPSGPDGPTRGYGIIQPSMRPTARGNQQSLFSALLTWQQSLVDYNSPAPNPLQDAFGETVFMGKGVYDIAVYGEVLNQRLPEDAVLSHDIIEGAYVRTGSATDVKLLEGLPTSFALFSRRGHRWMRGDWQNIVWLLRPRDKSGRGGAVTGFYRWAIFHNLKRSLREIALVVVLLIVWLSPHANIKLSTWILLILFAGPSYFVWLIGSALIFYKFRFHQSWFSYFVRKSALSLAGIFLRQVLQLSFLAYQSLIAIDAISRALLRLLTRKKLLEWASMQQTETEPRKLNIVDVYLRSMPLFSAIVLFAVVLLRPSAFWYSAPLALCWTISPPLSTWIGTPNKQKHMRSARGFKVK